MNGQYFDNGNNDNALLVTERCNNRCIFCCQPPVKHEDVEVLFSLNCQLIDTAPADLQEIGITGGEPALLGDRLFALIERIRERMPHTIIHLLSNGRAFADGGYAARLKQAGGDNLYVGVPLHSDYCDDHDRITRVSGSFEQTMMGLYQLGANGIAVELRVVVQKMNVMRLPMMADFIFRNLPFVQSVPFMALEDTGLARRNSDVVWVEPLDCMDALQKAVYGLADWNMNVQLFNYPLCLLSSSLHPFAACSISQWKRCYLPVCEWCRLREQCCGLFSTSQKVFRGVGEENDVLGSVRNLFF